jgi:ribonuclease J
VPVHGTLHHLGRHAALARELGVGDVMVLENGDVGELGPEGPLLKKGRVHAGRVHVFAKRPLPASVLHERMSLAAHGSAYVVVRVDAHGRLTGDVVLTTKGVLDETAEAHLLASARNEATTAVEELADGAPGGRPEEGAIAEAARLAVRRALGRTLGFKPVTTVTVLRQTR